MMPQSVDEFLAQWVKAGLASTDDAQQLRERLPPDAQTAEEVAKELVRQKRLTKYQAQMLYQGRGSSLTLGNYVIVDVLGRGGMGQVFKAEHRRMKRQVAMKLLPPQLVKDRQAIERFHREVEASARLNHPHIVAAFDAGEHNGRHYFVMEYVKGQDLAAVVKKQGPLPLERALDYTLQTARGLQYAHEHGVVHRDIKPANLLLGDDGVIKILDMGLARFEDELTGGQAALTGTGTIMGTVDFMAPEQGVNTKHADARSDIYSLGCTLYYLLEGKVAFSGETAVEKILAHREAPIPSLKDSHPEYPAEVDELLQRMLAKKPADRFQTAAEVIRALQRLAIPAATASGSTAFEPTKTFSPGSSDSGWNSPVESGLPADATPTQNNQQSEIGTSPDAPVSYSFDLAALEASSPNDSAERRRPQNVWLVAGGGGTLALLMVLAGICFWPQGKSPTTRPAVAAKTSVSPAEDAQPDVETTPEPMLVAAEGMAASVPTTPEPPIVPAAAPTEPARPGGGRTLVVGVGPGEIADLAAAFGQAQPGDTILIRHRGPLEFPPVDLTGKTPLTIAGDSKDGVDYWPIIQQQVLSPDSQAPPVAGLFYGKHLDVIFRRLHLGVSGRLRQPLSACFALGSGRVELEDCSVTVTCNGEHANPIGPRLPLILKTGTDSADLEIVLRRSFIRGGRLAGCLQAVSPGPVTVSAEQTLFAGGAFPWISLMEAMHPLRVHCRQSTLYGLSGLLVTQATAQIESRSPPLVDLQLQKTACVGARGTDSPMFSISVPGTSSFSEVVKSGYLACSAVGVLVHQIPQLYPAEAESRSSGKLKSFIEICGINPQEALELDPMFRVNPGGLELQEAAPRDFEVRLARNSLKTPKSFPASIGASANDLPPALACLTNRSAATPDTAAIPRGRPRVLTVDQTKGPFKTLEEAFAQVQDDEAIEIADDGTYSPRRNFNTEGGQAVLDISRVAHLELRAVDDSKAMLLLRDDLQKGMLPAFHPDSSPEFDLALYLASIKADSIRLDGLHFRVALTKPVRHSFLHLISPAVRITNCSFVDHTRAALASVDRYQPNRFVFQNSAPGVLGVVDVMDRYLWMENNVLVGYPPADSQLAGPQFEVGVGIAHYPLLPQPPVLRCVIARNCVFATSGVAFRVFAGVGEGREARLPEVITAERCTCFGHVFSIVGLRYEGQVLTQENLVITPDEPVLAEPSGLYGKYNVTGSSNAVWLHQAAIRQSERDDGSLRLFPGPLLKGSPQFVGNASAADPLRPYRLRSGQSGLKLSGDGREVGVRFEHLPVIPNFKQEEAKSR